MPPRKPVTPTPEDFRELLRDYCARHGISQGELGEKLGRNRVTIARWISGKQIPDELTRAGVAAILDK